MRKFERILFGATHCLVTLAMLACGSEDTGSGGHDSPVTSTTAGTPATTTATSGIASTSGGVGATSTTGAQTNGTTGVPATTGTTGSGTTGFGTTGSGTTGFGTTGFGTTGTTGASGVTGTSGSGTTAASGVTGSTTGGEDEVFCDATLTGEDFYKRPQSCTHCHGEDALGTEDGPEIRHPNADYVRWLVREGRMDHPDYPEGMPPVPSECLTDAMIEEIMTFLNSFPQPTTGAELYADYCANCHGADGRGGITGISLDGELHENAGIAVSGNATSMYGNREAYMPGQGDKLTTAEIQLITDYLQNELGFRF